MSTDRPLAFWLSDPAPDGPEPWDARDTADTDPAPPPVSTTRYAWTAPERAALPPRSQARRAARRTDPCITPPPGSDRGGDLGARVTVLPPVPWGGATMDGEEG